MHSAHEPQDGTHRISLARPPPCRMDDHLAVARRLVWPVDGRINLEFEHDTQDCYCIAFEALATFRFHVLIAGK